MRLFLYIFASAVVGASIVLLQQGLGPTPALALLGNVVFCAGVALAAYATSGGPRVPWQRLLLAPFAYVAAAVALTLAAALAYAWFRWDTLLMGLLALGYTSSDAGPDAPFFAQLQLWMLSNLLLIALSLAAGVALRRRRPAASGI